MTAAKNREGQTYRHKASDAIVLVVKTRFMSQGTARHTVVVLDAANSPRHNDGSQSEVDETPARPWLRDWDEL